ncbi:MAG: DUF2148 domain-containing protein [Methanothrix sp.]|nr:DUF2148 domain-containing protein [Methanothrix sp.]
MTERAVEIVAELMALSARTAPKGRGQDSIETVILSGDSLQELAGEMRKMGQERGLKFFLRDAANMEKSDACLIIGCKGESVGLDCGGCGHYQQPEKLFHGPCCAVKLTDLGIALGSAAKTASLHNVDNRIMFSAGAAALSKKLLPGSMVAYALPLKASGKSIYFDRTG